MNVLNYLITMVWASATVMFRNVASASRRPNILLLVVDDVGIPASVSMARRLEGAGRVSS